MTHTPLVDRIAIVTGASSGNGRGIALALAEKGATVVCADILTLPRPEGYEPDKDRTTAEAIQAGGGRAEQRLTDVRDAEAMRTLVEHTVSTYGRLDIFVNNAGIFTGLHSIVDETVEEFDDTIGVNLRGTWLGCKYAVAAMRGQEPNAGGIRGRIINIASTAGMTGLAEQPAYCASKGAVVALTRQLAVDCAPLRIGVSAICPGLIQTAMVRAWLDDAEMAAAWDGAYPWPDRGEAADVGRMAAFLASDDSRYAVGSIVLLDGGMTAGLPGA